MEGAMREEGGGWGFLERGEQLLALAVGLQPIERGCHLRLRGRLREKPTQTPAHAPTVEWMVWRD